MQENLFLSTSAALEEIQFAIIQAKKKINAHGKNRDTPRDDAYQIITFYNPK